MAGVTFEDAQAQNDALWLYVRCYDAAGALLAEADAFNVRPFELRSATVTAPAGTHSVAWALRGDNGSQVERGASFRAPRLSIS